MDDDPEALSSELVYIPQNKGSLRKLLAYLGPGFLVAIAYIDPANFESDLQAGAQFKYELLWVLLVASVGGLLIQSLAANLGVVTGKHLAQHCRLEYSPRLNFVLWIIAEIEIIASDIPEVIGTAFALNMLFRIRVWVGVILTGFSTLLLLALQRYGIRKLEVFVGLLILVIAACFFVEMAYAPINTAQVMEGMLLPYLRDPGATALAVSLVGAVVMPHNLFLHSALVLSRKAPRTPEGINDGCRFALIEAAFALLVAFAINVAVFCVSGSICNQPHPSPETQQQCANITLNTAYFLLQNTLGSWASTLFGVALLASGQSSTITGTFAGQYVMLGFLDLKMKTWIRNLMTRLVAILPSLAVALIGGSRGAGRLIILSSMILSFCLPYAVIPLLKFTSSPLKMGPFTSGPLVEVSAWLIGLLVIIINVYFLLDLLLRWLVFGSLPFTLRIPLIIVTFSLVCLYIISLLFLTLRPNTADTFQLIEEGKTEEAALGGIPETEMTSITDEKHNEEEMNGTSVPSTDRREVVDDDYGHEQQQLLKPSTVPSS